MTYAPLHALGASFVGSANFGATAVALVSPAANVKGLVLRTAVLTVASSVNGSLYATASTPTGDQQSALLMIARVMGGVGIESRFPVPLLVPAGLGIWVIASAGGGTTNQACITYDLL